MKKRLITLAFILGQIVQVNAQSLVTKYQNISSKGIEAIAPVDKIFKGSPNLTVCSGGEIMTQSSVLIQIEASGQNVPTRILNGLLEAGEFDLLFTIMDRQLLFHYHSPSHIIRFKGQEYTLELNYKIFVPKGMANLSELPTDTASK